MDEAWRKFGHPENDLELANYGANYKKSNHSMQLSTRNVMVSLSTAVVGDMIQVKITKIDVMFQHFNQVSTAAKTHRNK